MPIIRNGAVDLYFEVRGEGETLVLSSGLGGTGGYWAPQIEALARRFRVVTYDHAGSGRSSRDVGARSLAEFASDMHAVIRASGVEQAHVMGHAVGGITGLQMAIQSPETVRSLVMVNAWGAPDPHIARCFSVRSKLLTDSGLDAYIEAQPIFLYPACWMSEREAQLREAARHQPGHMPSRPDLLDRIAAFQRFAPSDASLAAVTMPVLCLATRDDMLVPWTASETLARRLGNAKFVLLPWGGHASSQSAPEDFDAALADFYSPFTEELVP